MDNTVIGCRRGIEIRLSRPVRRVFRRLAGDHLQESTRDMNDRRRMRWAALAGALCCALGAAASGVVLAADTVADGLALAAQRQCLGCHQVDARRVGPPFVAIADRFRDLPGAADHLARVMRQGSIGQWGAIPMPAQTRLSEADAARLSHWILSLAKTPPGQ